MGGDVRNFAIGGESAFPTDEERDTNSAFVGAAFEAFLSGVKHGHGLAARCFAERFVGAAGACSGHSVVGHENEDGVFLEIPLGEFCHEAPHVFVDVLDHAIEAGIFCGEAEVGEALGIGRRRNEGAVGGIGGDVGEEGFLFGLLFLDPAHGGGEEEVGAVALGFHERAVVANDGVEVFVPGHVGAGAFVSLSDAAGAVDEDFIKTSFVRLVGVLITQVPLAENTGRVACFFENLGKDGGIERQAFTLENGVGDAVFEGMATGHEGGAGGGASGADKEAGEAGALVVESVEVGGFDPGVAVFADRSVALVVGHHEDDVGLFDGRGERDEEEERREATDHGGKLP